MDNIINRFLLKVFLFPVFIYRKYGIDLHHLKAILTTKLIMDDRRASGFQRARNRNKNGETSTATLLTMFVSLIMGAAFLLTFQIQEDVTRLTAYFGLFVIMLSLFLITDFTYVLIDVKDNFIILPKPVTPATFLTARLLHIIIHITKIIIPLSLPGIIAVGISRGIWGAVIFIPIIALLTLFTLFVVNAAYLLILKIFSPEKFKSIITSVQIGFTIILYASFQIVPRMLENFDLQQIDISRYWYAWIIPSFWFAGAWKYLYTFIFDPAWIICTFLSLITPFISIWLVVRFFAPTFHRKLSLIASSESSGTKVVSAQKKQPGSVKHISTWLANLFTRPGVERGSFLFTWRFMARSREFKMKVYPQFGYMAVLVFLLIIRQRRSIIIDDPDILQRPAIFQILAIIYLCSFVFLGALYQMPYSENFKAGWVFFSSPIEKPGNIISGAIKTGFVKFCLPIMMIVFIIVVFFKGVALIPNLLFGFANVFLLCMIFARILIHHLPFSSPPKNVSDGSTSAVRIMMFFLIPVCALPHYFIFNYPFLAGFLSIIPLAIAFILLRGIKNMGWDKITAQE